MRDTGDEGLVAVLLKPWVIGAGAILLDVVESGDGSEGETSGKERPDVGWLGALWIGF